MPGHGPEGPRQARVRPHVADGAEEAGDRVEGLVARQLLQQIKSTRAQEREDKAAEREAQRGGYDRPDRFDRR